MMIDPIVCDIVWRSPSLLPVAESVIGFCALAVLLLYPKQVVSIATSSRWMLPGLRTLALTALGLSIMRPSAVRPSRPEELGPIAILLDCSDSMSAVDSNRSGAELVALADVTGHLPVASRSKAFATFAGHVDSLTAVARNAVRAESDFEYARVAGRSSEQSRQRMERADDELAIQVGGFGPSLLHSVGSSGELKQRMDELNQAAVSRGRVAWATDVLHKIQALSNAVSSAQHQADENLYRDNAAVRKACDEVAGLSRYQLATQALSRPGSGAIATLSGENKIESFAFAEKVVPMALDQGASPAATSSASTDISGALRQVLSGPQVPQAVVLISDGRQVAMANSSAGAAAALASAGVPIYCVNPAANEIRDLSIASVSMPASVYRGEKLSIGVLVRAPGFGGSQIDVELYASPALRAPLHQTARVDAQERAQIRFELDTQAAAADVQPIEIRVRPLAGEASIANNSVQRWVKVVSDRIKVASFASEPTWDFQLLNNRLGRTPWVQLTQAALGATRRLTLSPAQILEQDIIILNDVAPSSLDYAQWDAVRRLIDERGGSVVFIAGESNWPADYALRPETQDLVPYSSEPSPTWRIWSGDNPYFHFAPAVGAQTHPALKNQTWERAGAVFRFLQLPQLKANVQPLLVERESLAPLLTESRLGLGKIFFLASNETWRWRLSESAAGGAGNDVHEGLWLSLIRYATDEPYFARDANWALDVDRLWLEPGQSAQIRVKRFGLTGRPRLEIYSADQQLVRTQEMIASASPGRFTAEVKDLSQGAYSLRLAGDSKLALGLHVLSSREKEMRDLSPDLRMLKTIAEPSGGELLPLSELPSLVPKLQRQRQERFSLHERPLWDSGYLFLFVIGCLGLEWGLRKRLGLP